MDIDPEEFTQGFLKDPRSQGVLMKGLLSSLALLGCSSNLVRLEPWLQLGELG